MGRITESSSFAYTDTERATSLVQRLLAQILIVRSVKTNLLREKQKI